MTNPIPTVVVVLPSTTYRARDFLVSAQGLGVEVIVASDVPPPFDMGHRYVEVDCEDPATAAAQIVALSDRTHIDGVVAADDGGVVIASLAADRLGLRGNSPESAAATLDKGAQRRAMATAEVPQPAFRIIFPGDDPPADVRFPVIVKPTDRAAGQGVVRADHPDDLRARIEEVREIVGSDAQLVVEEYMSGNEIALEGLLSQGALTTLAIFDKPDAATGPAFPETILVTPSILNADQQNEVERVAIQAVRALGLWHGPVHIEMKVEEGMARVIEVAARSIGGLCSRSLSFGLMNTTLESLILRNALGLDKAELRREPHASGVLMLPIHRAGRYRGLINETEIRTVDGVTGIEMNLAEGTYVQPTPVGDRYLGFVFARGRHRQEVADALLEVRRIAKVDIR